MRKHLICLLLCSLAGGLFFSLPTMVQGLAQENLPPGESVVAALALGGLGGPLLYLWRRLANRPNGQELEAARHFRELYQRTPVMLHSIDAGGRLVSVSDCWLETLGYRREEVIGHPLTEFMTEGSRQTAETLTLPELFTTGQVKDVACQLVKKHGEVIDALLSAVAERDRGGNIRRSLAVVTDVTERRRSEQEIEKLAYYDTLTGLPNRSLFQDRLSQAMAQAHREGAGVGLMFLDLDRFKSINDTLGHATGDRLLQVVANRLKKCVREGDTVARLGGDEFVIISTDFTHHQDPVAFAKRLLRVVGQPVQFDGREFVTTASIGIAIYPNDGADVSTLIGNADFAMYHAKELGRNTYQFFSAEMNARALEKLNLETSLRQALKRGELFLVYQPQLDLASGRITGVEALARWRHPEKGLIPPEKFIPIAEETGLILPLGEWVLRTACAQARAWQAAGVPGLRIAVNVSARQFNHPEFLETVERILQETGLDPNLLELELTESIVMENVQDAIMTLTDLKVRNIHLAIDDFGTGYSSLTYLKHFPIDRIKIAQEFVRDIPNDADDAAIVEAILAMAGSLNLEVIAEGVERKDQLGFLHQRRCKEMQGYYFARPMPAEQLAEIFSRGLAREPACLYEG
ncbi:hypothetical protein DESUT3_09730 [Desulfuromonas versatilis]|uniref:Diguanylate cyclase/phosphodiesterase with PAS/PAC sensor(S) n=1 Tax=Desulfuromonas versatilis TaxID=2802975 RepID=A0ABN6DXF9_9BACT|nr:EAL domain-containing protein [Desulfuromonas versatilis]BCR03904.1 hypothetical protein DESUT3_09730 [Desulfuromonas versatilis]